MTSVKNSDVYWLGKVASDWEIAPAWRVMKERGEKSLPDDVHLTPSQTHGVLTQQDYMDRTGNKVVLNLAGTDNMKRVRAGDFIIHLRSFQGGIEASAIDGKVSNAYTVLTPAPDAHFGYYRWFMKSVPLIEGLASSTDQLRDGQSINFSRFSRLSLPLPPLETQQRIADYLDRETAEIDAAVADLDRYVELLEKRRRAKITFAVEGKSNLVKDNSTESHPVANLGLVAHAYQPETLSMEALNQSGTFPVFGANGIIGRHDNFNHEQPQVVIACRGNTCGAVNRTLPKSWINGNAMVINPYAEKLRKDFLFYVLEIADYSLVITGSAQPQIIRESLYRLRVPLPPLETQRRIADYLDRETTEIDSLIADSTRLRDLLLKRRSVLITEVVTGRKQV